MAGQCGLAILISPQPMLLAPDKPVSWWLANDVRLWQHAATIRLSPSFAPMAHRLMEPDECDWLR